MSAAMEYEPKYDDFNPVPSCVVLKLEARIAELEAQVEALVSDELPPGWRYTEPHTLLEEINAAAHTRGVNAWVRDVLQRAHRAVAQVEAVRVEEREAHAPVVEALEACKRDLLEWLLARIGEEDWTAIGDAQFNGWLASLRDQIDAALEAIRARVHASPDGEGSKGK